MVRGYGESGENDSCWLMDDDDDDGMDDDGMDDDGMDDDDDRDGWL